MTVTHFIVCVVVWGCRCSSPPHNTPQVQDGAVLCSSDLNPRALVMQRYALGAADALALAIKRQWLFFLRNKAFIVFRLLQVTGLWWRGCCSCCCSGYAMRASPCHP